MGLFDDPQSIIKVYSAIIGIVICAILVYRLITYIVWSFAYKRIFTTFQIQNPNVAWIPYYRKYILCTLATQTTGSYSGGIVTLPNWLLSSGWLLVTLINAIPGIGTVASIAGRIIIYSSVFTFLFSRMEGKKETEVQGFSVLCAIIPIVALVKFFLLPAGVLKYRASTDIFPQIRW